MPWIRLILHECVGPEQETKSGESATVCAAYAVAAADGSIHSGRAIPNVPLFCDAKIFFVLPLHSISASSCT